MKPAIEQAVAEALPHSAACQSQLNRWSDGLCVCDANKKRNILLAKLSTQNGYVYLDRRH